MANNISDEIAKQRSALVEKYYPSSDSPYRDIFGQGYEQLGQPKNIATRLPDPSDPYYGADQQTMDAQGRLRVAIGGTQQLASTFVDEFYKKFGKLPTESQMQSFVGENLTPSFAQKFITGIPNEAVVSQYIKPYLTFNEQDLATEAGVTTGTPSDDLSKRVGDLYRQMREAVPLQAEDYFNPQKAKIAQDLAAQGLLNQPVSRLTFNQLEGGKQRSITEALAGLAGQQASGEIDLAKTLAGLREGARQFGVESGLKRQQFMSDQERYANDLALQRQQLGLASYLGRLQGKAGPSGTSRGISGALTGGAGGAAAGAGFGPWGALIGGLSGAALGGVGGAYF